MIHLALSMSAAGCLRQALPRGMAVFGLPSRMNAGPINDPCGDEYLAFQCVIDRAYPTATCEDEDAGSKPREPIRNFWQAALADQKRTVWYSSRAASDICALSIIVRDSGSLEKMRLIDVDAHWEDEPVLSVGEIAPERLAVLCDKSKRPDAKFARHLLSCLSLSVAQPDLPLRWWIAHDTVAPVSWVVIDAAIIASFRHQRALPAARLVGETLSILPCEANNVDDGLVWYRLRELIDTGLLAMSDPDGPMAFETEIQMPGSGRSTAA